MNNNINNGQSASKYLSDLVKSYDKSSQTSELSRRILNLISEKGDIEIFSFENVLPSTISISGIYLLITEDKPRIYIGSSINIFNRLRKHRTALRAKTHHNKHFNNIYNKNLKFYYCILEKTENLDEREQYFINYLNATLSINKTIDTLRNFYNEKLIKNNKIRNSKKVYVYDIKGNYINEYDSVSECSRILFNNINSNTKISRVCLNKSKSYRNYRFKYIKYDKLTPYIKLFNTSNANKKCSKKIKCLNNNKIYNSISEACRDLNIPGTSYIINNRYKEYKFIKI